MESSGLVLCSRAVPSSRIEHDPPLTGRFMPKARGGLYGQRGPLLTWHALPCSTLRLALPHPERDGEAR